jgi:uncharacterized protein YjbJ (UPF0337 family)
MDNDRIVGAAKDYAGQAQSTFGELTGDKETEAAGRMREAAGTAQNLYGKAKDTAREATETAASYAKQAYEHGGVAFRDGSQALAKRVRESPLSSLLIAGGIGFALAMMMMRPQRRPPPRYWRY